MESTFVPALTSVAVVVHDKSVDRDVENLVSQFLDASSLLRFHQAVRHNSLRLMKRWMLQAHEHVGYNDWREALGTAIAAENLDLLKCIVQLHPDRCIPRDALNTAASVGHLPSLQYLFSKRPTALTHECINAASHHGCLNVLEWIYFGQQERIADSNSAFESACESGDLHTVKWLYGHSIGGYNISAAMTKAASNGHVHVMEYIESLQTESTWFSTIDLPALSRSCCKSGSLQTLLWLDKKQKEYLDEPISYRDCLPSAAASGNLHMVRWLYHAHCEGRAVGAAVVASRHGHLDILKWLLQKYPHSFNSLHPIAHESVVYGHLHILEYLQSDHNMLGDLHDPFNERAGSLLLEALSSGHTHIIQWFHVRSPLTRIRVFQQIIGSCTKAQVVQWSMQNLRCSYNEFAIRALARSGDLASIQKLSSDESNRFHASVLDAAAAHGHLDIVKWLHEHRLEGGSTEAMDMAASHGHYTVVQYLHEQGYSASSKAMDGAAAHGHLDIAMFLDANRTEGCTTLAIDDACKNGHLDVVSYLYEHRTERCSVRALEKASRNGYLDVVVYLYEHVGLTDTSGLAMQAALSSGFRAVHKYLVQKQS